MAKIVVNMDIKSTLIGKGFVALGISLCCKASQGDKVYHNSFLHCEISCLKNLVVMNVAFERDSLILIIIYTHLISVALRHMYCFFLTNYTK